MSPEARRWRLRLLVGENIVALGVPGHSADCLHGSAWTKRELDHMAEMLWKMGRSTPSGGVFGGSTDGAQA